MRTSGVLLPITSLPSEYGIGCFDEEAYTFVDILKEAGQKYWQVLPFGHTSYGDSPYQSFSTFAGNPYFVSLKELIKKGYITEADCEAAQMEGHPEYVDYERIYKGRYKVLRKAFEKSNIRNEWEYRKFVDENRSWLIDYALFMAIKDANDGDSFIEWDDDIKLRKPEALNHYHEKYKEDVEFYCFIQYEFFRQWEKLKKYANDNGISIVGDIPIYVAYDSADVWTHPELFQLDEKLVPIKVAGCPPDAFCEDGQLWGNPLYKWDYHKNTGFRWWKDRIRACNKLYDLVRIDHFRGFDEYYTIPFEDETARNGCWEKGPGIDLFNELNREFGKMNIIAEDLGFLTDSVRQLLKDTAFPGMKVLQFAMYEGSDNEYLPYRYPNNCVVYTGTHDNDTLVGWYDKLDESSKKFISDYLMVEDESKIHFHFIKAALESVADYCIIPAQDYLGLGSEARINTPSTVGDNWKWRMKKGAFDEKLVAKMRRLATIYGRTRG
ncbi:MAG: 4-alpha-glucanotransferase [Lachnospiraceae bacterium]|nr:4-alpha-glucanotransferase [Lachnospiraceae bacterium]